MVRQPTRQALFMAQVSYLLSNFFRNIFWLNIELMNTSKQFTQVSNCRIFTVCGSIWACNGLYSRTNREDEHDVHEQRPATPGFPSKSWCYRPSWGPVRMPSQGKSDLLYPFHIVAAYWVHRHVIEVQLHRNRVYIFKDEYHSVEQLGK